MKFGTERYGTEDFQIWNVIPDNIKNTASLEIYKKESKSRKAKHVLVGFVAFTCKTLVLSKRNHFSFTTSIYIARLNFRASEQPTLFYDFIGFYLLNGSGINFD